MKQMKKTTLTSVLKTLTVAIALSIASQAQAQHTQGPTVEGVALPNLGGGEEGEITEEQVLEVQRQCNENLVKEYLYTGSGGKISLVGKLEFSADISFPENDKERTTIYLNGSTGSNTIRFNQKMNTWSIYNPQLNLNKFGADSSMLIQILKNTSNNIEVNLYAFKAPSFLMDIERKWNFDSLGVVVSKKNVIIKLSLISYEDQSIDFLAFGFNKSQTTIFSYPTAKYVSCLKAGVASLAK